MAGDRYKDEKFVGWLKVNMSLIFAKEGIEQFSDDEVQTFHDNIKRNIPSSSAPGPHTCIDNTQSRQDNKRKLRQEWQKGRFSCQADQCHLWLGGIRKEYLGSPKSVEWDNCNLAQLSTDPWACAKLLMPYGSASYTQASDTDIASLLTLFLRCSHFRKFFNQVDVCQKVKNIRNQMMHTCKMEVDAASVTEYTTQIIEFLEDPKHLLHQPPCQEAVRKIKELLSGKTEISLNKELELQVLNTELHNLVDKVKALGSKIQDTGADSTSNAEDLKKLKTELAPALGTNVHKTSKDLTANAEDLKTQETEQQHLKYELALVKSRSEDFSQFITDYKINGVSTEKLSEVSNKIARLENDVQTQLDKLTDQVEKLKIQSKTLTTEQSGQKQRLTALETSHSSVSQEQGSQRQRLDQLETGHSSVSQEQGRQRLDQLETGHLSVSQEQGSQRQRLHQLVTAVSLEQGSHRQRLDQLETGHLSVSQEQGSQRQRLYQLVTAVSLEQGSHRQRLDQLETGHLSVSQEQGSQRQRLDQLETGHSAVSQEQGSQRQRVDQLETGHSAVSQEQASQRQRVDQLETGHSSVSQEPGSQRQRLDQLETGHSSVSQEQGSQRQRVGKLETGHSAVSQEPGSQRQRLDQLETGHSAVSQEQGNQRQRVDKLETGHSAVSQEQGSQRQRLDQLETGHAAVSQEQGSQRQRLDQLKTGHSAVSQEQGSQRQRVDKLETGNSALSQKQGSQRQRDGKLETGNSALSQKQWSQRQRVDKLETGHSAVSKEQGNHNQRIDKLETGHSAVSQEQGSQRQRDGQLETGHSSVSQEQGSQRQRVGKLETGHSAVSQEQRSQRQRADQLETAVSQEQGNQRQRVDKLETGHSAVSQEQGSQRQRLDQLGTGHAAVSQEQGSQRQRVDKLETGHSAVSQEQGNQRQRVDQLETDHSAVSQEQRSQRQRVDQLETDHSSVSQDRGSQIQRDDKLETGHSAVSQEQGSQKQRLDQLETGMSDISQEQLQLKRDVQENLAMRETTCQDIQRRLISFYKRECQTIPIYPLRPEWRQHVASLFVLPSMKVTNPRGISKHHLMRGTDEGPDIKVTSIQDIFPPAGSSCSDIYIMGDAGTGKSTLCEYMVHLWVSCQTSSNQAQENFMERFEFLFYISLREARSCNVEEMLQSQLKLKSVNVSRLLYDHTSLIILEGLDEYSLKQTSRSRFGSENVPYRDHSDKCTFLTTSRPWKLELLRRELEHTIDRQISIVGLDTESQKKLVGRVVELLNSENNCDKNPEDFFTVVQKQQLDTFMNTPVLVMQMVGFWFSGESLGESRCSISAKLVDKQIQFTEEVRGFPADPSFHRAPPTMPELQCDDETREQELFAKYFNNYPFIKSYKNLLQKVCKFAYDSLSSKDRENSLVFSHEQMERSGMSREEIFLCLDLGLLTQYKVFGGITQRLKSLSFSHKSIQEFFAAIYLSLIDHSDARKSHL